MMEQISKKIEGLTSDWMRFQASHDQGSQALENRLYSLEQRYNSLLVDGKRPSSTSQGNSERVGDFIRKGNVHPSLIRKADPLLARASEPNLAVVESSMSKKIHSLLRVLSPIRKLASVEEVSTSALEVLIQEEEFECSWVSESSDRPDTRPAELKKKRILLHQLYAQPKASQTLLEDACVDVEAWLIEQLGQSFAKRESESFIRGDGQNKPEGILQPGALNIANKLQVENRENLVQSIVQLTNKIEEGYHHNASFLMSRSTLLEVQQLKDNQGRFLWQPSLGDALPESLLGRPVYCSDYMPSFDSNAVPVILFGDFKSAYKIVDHSEMTVMRDPFSYKPFISFYAVKRVGGAVLDKNALAWLQFNN